MVYSLVKASLDQLIQLLSQHKQSIETQLTVNEKCDYAGESKRDANNLSGNACDYVNFVL